MKETNNRKKETDNDTIANENAVAELKTGIVPPPSGHSVGIDIDYYQAIIDDPEISEERKRELIEVIGSIVVSFIDLGFGVHPVQLAQQECHTSKHERKQSEKETEKKGTNTHATIP